MSSSEAVSDDLEVIKGIGPDTRKWLVETFDARTFSALAELSEEQVLNQIGADNKPAVWKRWARDWPREAAKKAAETEAAIEARQPGPASGRQANDSPLMASGTEPSSPKPNPKPNNPAKTRHGWDTLGLYFIEFQSRQVPGKPVERQTKIVFEGPGPQTQKTLPDIEQDRICQWIFDHFDGILGAMPAPATETLPGAETTPSEIGPSAVSISELRLFQPAGAGSPLFSYSSEQLKTLLWKQSWKKSHRGPLQMVGSLSTSSSTSRIGTPENSPLSAPSSLKRSRIIWLTQPCSQVSACHEASTDCKC
jgi:hypothetical protein